MYSTPMTLQPGPASDASGSSAHRLLMMAIDSAPVLPNIRHSVTCRDHRVGVVEVGAVIVMYGFCMQHQVIWSQAFDDGDGQSPRVAEHQAQRHLPVVTRHPR
jgi:hypothetical protein